MGTLASLMVSIAGKAAARRFEAATRDPVGTQERKLRQLVEKNAETEYGREFAFRSIRTLADWRAAVPVVTYEDLQPRIERIIRGEKNVLTAEDPVMFARTSGTTGDAKYVPVTKTCQGRDHADQIRTWLWHALRDHPGLFSRKVVSLVSPAIEGHVPSGLPFGSTSGHIYKNLPRLIRGTYLVPYEVFELDDYETKYYAIMRLGIGADVSFAATANPSSLIKMCEMAQLHADALLKDLHDGTLRTDLAIPAATRALILARCRRDPARARALEAARKHRSGLLLPADYWPNLALIGCWKGGTVGSYVERFPGWFDPEGKRPVPVRDWGFLSSEARGSIPLSDEGSGGVLTVATNVYEFVEVNQLENAVDDRRSWRFLGVDEIEVGREYYIFFSTTGGLYRYDINDVVEVAGHYHRTPVIVFRRKGRGMTNITGEKVSVNQVISAFSDSAREFGLTIDHFKAEADLEGARYVFRTESRNAIPADQRRPFLHALDRRLSEQNIEYLAKRKSLRLNPPELHVMRPGWYDNEKKRLIAAGKRLFQAKTIVLATRHEDHKSSQTEDIVSFDA